MSDKNLDELLAGLKQEYEQIPERVEKRTIMQRIFRKEKKPRFRKMMPLVAVVASLILFMLVSLPHVMDFDQADNNPNYLELYYLNALDEFKDALGLQDMEEFYEVQRAKEVVEHYDGSSGSADYEDAKEEIDYYLTTPKEMVEKAKREGTFLTDDDQFNRKIQDMHFSLQSYFSDLLVEYGIQRKDQDAILEAMGKPENYRGPQEIRDFLLILEEQGFTVVRLEDSDQLKVGMDFSWQLENSEIISGNEGYKRYLALMAGISDDFYEREWNEMDSILLEAEEIYDHYPEEREAIFENTSFLAHINHYLREYLAITSTGDEMDEKELLEEYYSFLERHEDSRFWEIVKARVDTIEMTSTDYLNYYIGSEIYLLFNEQFDGITFNDIINLNYDERFPASRIQEIYVEFGEKEDEKMLNNLAPAEAVLLYKYAFERSNAGLYSTLYAAGSRWEGHNPEELHDVLLEEKWMDIFEHSQSMVIEEESGGDRFTATFIIGFKNEAIAQMEWEKEDGIWRLVDQSVEDLSQIERGL